MAQDGLKKSERGGHPMKYHSEWFKEDNTWPSSKIAIMSESIVCNYHPWCKVLSLGCSLFILNECFQKKDCSEFLTGWSPFYCPPLPKGSMGQLHLPTDLPSKINIRIVSKSRPYQSHRLLCFFLLGTMKIPFWFYRNPAGLAVSFGAFFSSMLHPTTWFPTSECGNASLGKR